MAWSDNLLNCSFRGIVFDVQRAQDNADRATAEHTYPYVDGADIEDTGRGPRVFNIDAIFYGSDYDQRLQKFLQSLDQVSGSGELIHPIYGSIPKAQLRRRTVSHDAEGVDQCTVSMEFVESTPSNPFFDRQLASQKVDVISQHGDLALSEIAAAIGNAIDYLRNASPLAQLNTLRQQLTGPILATFSQVQGVLLSGLDVLSFPRAWANDLSSIVDGVLNLYDFNDKLMSDWSQAGKVFQLFDTFGTGGSSSSSGTSTGTSPVAQIRPGVAPTEAQAVAAVQAHISVSTAVGVANAAGLILAAEADPAHGATLSPPDVETITDAARTRISSAIAAIRAIYPLETARAITDPLKDQALALQDAAKAIIEARPPLMQKTLAAPGNLRLQAHLLYGDHTRATELARLNPSLRLPNNLQQGDVINAFTS